MVGVLVFGVSSCVSTREKPLPVEGARAELWLAPLASCAEERALETRKLDRRTQVRVDEYTTVEYLLRELCAGDGTSCPYSSGAPMAAACAAAARAPAPSSA